MFGIMAYRGGALAKNMHQKQHLAKTIVRSNIEA